MSIERFPVSLTIRISIQDRERLRKLAEGSPATEHGWARHCFLLGLAQAGADRDGALHGDR